MPGKFLLLVSRRVVLFAIVISATVAMGDACTNTVGPFPLKRFLGGGASYTSNLMEEKSPQCVLITITDVSWLTPTNINFVENKGDTTDTDRAVLKNDAMGKATICFSSDPDTSDCTLAANPDFTLKVTEDAEKGADFKITVKRGDNFNGAAKWDSFKLEFFSDSDEDEPLVSDFVTLSNPEPSTLSLLGISISIGVAALRKKLK
jgi:hypothetical protein